MQARPRLAQEVEAEWSGVQGQSEVRSTYISLGDKRACLKINKTKSR